jgi:hypothetical protein
MKRRAGFGGFALFTRRHRAFMLSDGILLQTAPLLEETKNKDQ